MTPRMTPEEADRILDGLKDPTTTSVLAEALGYKSYRSIVHACIDGRIPGAEKRGGIWFIPVDSARQAIRQGTLKPLRK